MGRTKKVGVAGTYGSRYGKTMRDRIKRVHAVRHAPHRCSRCLKQRIVRDAPGIWRCTVCSLKFAGKAHTPS
ncbi:MAG: 50S ribosomal protein L37ae [Nanoarchaeota archaeon]|nr:50S ribosomal protein L37ae [Nanoarchaeota archaeon]